jgi:hypothetical protein
MVTPKPKPKQKPRPKPKQKGGEAPTGLVLPEPAVEQPASATTHSLSLQERAWLWLNDKTKASFEAQPHPSLWPEVHELDARVRARFGITGGVQISKRATHELSDPRIVVPLKRWSEGISQQDLLDAIDGSANDPYLSSHPGQRTVRWILDNADRVQEFMLNVRKTEAVTAVRPTRRAHDPDEDILAARKRAQNQAALANATPEEIKQAEANAAAIAKTARGLFR